jgi:glutamyl-tRNA synthetase
LYNYLFARQQGGKLILRIEDTDQTRYVPGAEAYIMEALTWFGIAFDEGVSEGGPHGPYRQSERAAQGLYRQYAEQLVAQGDAYYAFDTAEELDALREALRAEGSSVQQYNAVTRDRMTNSFTLEGAEVERRIEAGEPYVVRMKMPADEDITFTDIVRETVSFHSQQLDDKVLIKSDGLPTYHLANVVDDHLMAVTHVIRGEEWLSSTPLHVLLYRCLGWADTMPRFVHLPLILNPNGQGKMSKRQGDKLGFSVFPTQWQDPETGQVSTGYREDGYLPDALMNFLAFLGWSPGDDEELMDEARLIERFSLERIGKSGTKFDLDKLNWFNQTYLRERHQATDLLPLVRSEVMQAGYPVPEDPYLLRAIELMQERAIVVPDFVRTAPFLYVAPQHYEEQMVKKRWKSDSSALMMDLKARWAKLSDWSPASLEQAMEALIAAHEVGKGKVMAPLRLCLTGMSAGPGVFDIAALIGQAACLDRLDQAVATLGE